MSTLLTLLVTALVWPSALACALIRAAVDRIGR